MISLYGIYALIFADEREIGRGAHSTCDSSNQFLSTAIFIALPYCGRLLSGHHSNSVFTRNPESGFIWKCSTPYSCIQ